jgi:murein DD-endopeptidase MepM/ murein hydrolase activator NlpD
VPNHGPRQRAVRLVAPTVVALIAFVSVALVVVPNVAPSAMPPAGAVGAVAGAADVGPSSGPAGAVPPPTAATAADGGDANRTTSPPPMPPETAVPAATPPPLADLTGYRWPLPRGRLTLPFGPSPWGSRLVEGKPFHDGIDLATVCGDRIVAAHDGFVLAAGRHFDDAIGWVGDLSAYYRRLDAKQLWSTLPIVVIIDDGNGYRSIYAHFSNIVVTVGQMVHGGQLIGYEGRTGRASGCHLHYGLFSTDEPGRFTIEASVVKRMKVPAIEIARVDPLLVLPARPATSPKAAPSPTS